MTHANAPFTEEGRLRLARLVVDQGWPIERVADRFQCASGTVRRWVERYRAGEPMTDRSSRPHRSPNRVPTRLERRIIGLRFNRNPTPVGDKVTRGVIVGVPLLAGVAIVALNGSLAAPGALLSGVALLAGGFLAAFAQITNLRFKLTERMRDFPDAERVDRDALDETASHLLVAAYLSALTALLLVLAMNFGTNALGAVTGVWAGVVVAPATYVLLTFLIALPRLYSAYVTFNAVRPELSGAHRS